MELETKEVWDEYNRGKEDFNKLFNTPKTIKIFEPTYHAVLKIYELGHKRNPKIIKRFDKLLGKVDVEIKDIDRLKTLALFSITYPIHCAYVPNWKNHYRNIETIKICKELYELALMR